MSLSKEDHDALMYAIGVGLSNMNKTTEPGKRKKAKTTANKTSKHAQEWSEEDDSLQVLPEPSKRKVNKTSAKSADGPAKGRGRGAAKGGRGGHGGRSRRTSLAGCASCGHDQ